MKDKGYGEIEFNKAEQMIIRAAEECFDESEFVDHDAAVIKFQAYAEMAIATGQTTKEVVDNIKTTVKYLVKYLKK